MGKSSGHSNRVGLGVLSRCLDGGSDMVNGSGNQLRSFVDVDGVTLRLKVGFFGGIGAGGSDFGGERFGAVHILRHHYGVVFDNGACLLQECKVLCTCIHHQPVHFELDVPFELKGQIAVVCPAEEHLKTLEERPARCGKFDTLALFMCERPIPKLCLHFRNKKTRQHRITCQCLCEVKDDDNLTLLKCFRTSATTLEQKCIPLFTKVM
nr:unnamed protein product [Callosobruchus analis]